MRLTIMLVLATAVVAFSFTKWMKYDAESRLRAQYCESLSASENQGDRDEADDLYFHAEGTTLVVDYATPVQDTQAQARADYFAHRQTRTLLSLGFARVRVAERTERIQ